MNFSTVSRTSLYGRCTISTGSDGAPTINLISWLRHPAWNGAICPKISLTKLSSMDNDRGEVDQNTCSVFSDYESVSAEACGCSSSNHDLLLCSTTFWTYAVWNIHYTIPKASSLNNEWTPRLFMRIQLFNAGIAFDWSRKPPNLAVLSNRMENDSLHERKIDSIPFQMLNLHRPNLCLYRNGSWTALELEITVNSAVHCWCNGPT